MRRTYVSVFVLWVYAALMSNASAQMSFEQALNNQWQTVGGQQSSIARGNANARNQIMQQMMRERERARNNQVLINQKAFETRRKRYLERLDKKNCELVAEWREKMKASGLTSQWESNAAVLEFLAGIGTIIWAEELKGKNNDLLYGAICPAVMEQFGVELIKQSARYSELDESLIAPAAVAIAGAVKLFYSKNLNDDLEFIGQNAAKDFVLAELEKVDPRLSCLSDLAAKIDVALSIIRNMQGK